MINFSQLPEWFNRNVWVKQVMQSGLKGKYVMAIDENGWITEIKSLDIDLPVELSIDFKRIFQKEYLPVELFDGDLKSIIMNAHYESINYIDNLPYLYHYYRSQLANWYDNHYLSGRSISIYHDNDAIARKTLSARDDEKVVIFEITPNSGWSKPLQWNPKALGSLSFLFGGESHD